MKCPIDETTLVMTERTGIEIDYCPACRGVWLDRGELDKIIERSVDGSGSRGSGSHGSGSHGGEQRHRGHDDDGHRDRSRRRESWLSNLFD